MPTSELLSHPIIRKVEALGQRTIQLVDSIGFGASLVYQTGYWLLLGRRHHQAVHLAPIVAQIMEVGIRAIPIIALVSLTIGLMLAIQGIVALKAFGAEQQVTYGVALSVVREFSPLMTGILVAGRSGAALAARLGTMTIHSEVDALRVMGVNPIRFLVVPNFIAMLIVLPALTWFSDLIALSGAGLYITTDLGISFSRYLQQTMSLLHIHDVMHGLGKSLVFGALITLVGVINGSSVTGGAEGVGRVTTNAVVHSILAIILADLLIVFILTK
ncbi:MlaE family ABC transporter permease [Nitrospira sp. M1]